MNFLLLKIQYSLLKININQNNSKNNLNISIYLKIFSK